MYRFLEMSTTIHPVYISVSLRCQLLFISYHLAYAWHEFLAGHPWVQVDGVAPDKPLDSAVLSRLKQFRAMNKLKKMALRVSFYMLKMESFFDWGECIKSLREDIFRTPYAGDGNGGVSWTKRYENYGVHQYCKFFIVKQFFFVSLSLHTTITSSHIPRLVVHIFLSLLYLLNASPPIKAGYMMKNNL